MVIVLGLLLGLESSCACEIDAKYCGRSNDQHCILICDSSSLVRTNSIFWQCIAHCNRNNRSKIILSSVSSSHIAFENQIRHDQVAVIARRSRTVSVLFMRILVCLTKATAERFVSEILRSLHLSHYLAKDQYGYTWASNFRTAWNSQCASIDCLVIC